MICIDGISKSFRGGARPVLSNVNAKLDAGSVYGLIGYNGAGKTTLLKIIAGIYRPDSGRVLIDGRSVYEDPESKKRIYMMTEELFFLPQATMEDMDRFYRGYYEKWDSSIYSDLMDLFGLPPQIRITGFSKGMQRQAGLVAAFASGSDVLLLDEAFDGLDLGVRRSMRDLLRYYSKQQKAAVVITSHNLDELEACADRFGMISEGTLEYDMELSEIRDKGLTLGEFFLRGKERSNDWAGIFSK